MTQTHCLFFRTVNQNVYPRPTHYHVHPLQHPELRRAEDGTSLWETGAGLGVSFHNATYLRGLLNSDAAGFTRTNASYGLYWSGCNGYSWPARTKARFSNTVLCVICFFLVSCCYLNAVLLAMVTVDGTVELICISSRRARQCTSLPVWLCFITSTTAHNGTIVNTQTASAG